MHHSKIRLAMSQMGSTGAISVASSAREKSLRKQTETLRGRRLQGHARRGRMLAVQDRRAMKSMGAVACSARKDIPRLCAAVRVASAATTSLLFAGLRSTATLDRPLDQRATRTRSECCRLRFGPWEVLVVLASEPPGNDDLALAIHAVDLEHLLC